jgi:hypothetical protein
MQIMYYIQCTCTDMQLEWVEFFSFHMYDWILDFPIHCSIYQWVWILKISGMILGVIGTCRPILQFIY